MLHQTPFRQHYALRVSTYGHVKNGEPIVVSYCLVDEPGRHVRQRHQNTGGSHGLAIVKVDERHPHSLNLGHQIDGHVTDRFPDIAQQTPTFFFGVVSCHAHTERWMRPRVEAGRIKLTDVRICGIHQGFARAAKICLKAAVGVFQFDHARHSRVARLTLE